MNNEQAWVDLADKHETLGYTHHQNSVMSWSPKLWDMLDTTILNSVLQQLGLSGLLL